MKVVSFFSGCDGLDDDRGKVFLDYIRLIKGKKPKFFVNDIRNGYKMVGNAVPPKLAYQIAIALKTSLV